MSDDQNTTQNPISEETTPKDGQASIPTSPSSSAEGYGRTQQEPIEPAPENTAHSEPSVMPSEAPEAPRNDFPVKSNIVRDSPRTLARVVKMFLFRS